jgi:integrase
VHPLEHLFSALERKVNGSDALRKLTEKEIKGAKPKLSSSGTAVKYELVDSTHERGVGRLVVRVSVAGSKEFVYKYKVAGKVSYVQLGRFPAMTLANARESIKPLINLLIDGLDPKTELKRQKLQREVTERSESMSGSVNQLFQAYTEKMKRDGKRTYLAVLNSLEKETYPVIPENTKAKDVTRDQVKRIIANLIERGAPTQSNRVRSYLMAAFNYALEHDNDPATLVQDLNFGIQSNPVNGIPKQKNAERVGNNYLNLEETCYVLSTFGSVARIGIMCNTLFELCFHTGGQRPYELSASRWEFVNWEERTLLITTDISKNKRLHIIPLSNSAILLLKNLKKISRGSPFIFPQKQNLYMHIRTDSFSKAIARYRDSNPEFKKFVARDIRRTCKTLMGELGISKEIRDRLQNHSLQDVSSKHYDRYDYLSEKRDAINKWEQRISKKLFDYV